MELVQEDLKPSSVFFRKTTLGELGNRLPIYRVGQDKKPIEKNEFTFIPWDMEMEEKLAEKQEKSKGRGTFINEMMCMLLDNFCGQEFQEMKPEERAVVMNQLEWSNMMYMYIYLRVEELGSNMSLNLMCPNPRCQQQLDNYVVDLKGLDVHVKEYNFEKKEADHPRVSTYDLVKPIILKDGLTISAINFDMSRWDYMEKSDNKDGINAGKLKMFMLKSSVVGFKNGEEKVTKFLDPQQVFSRMKKIDIEQCTRFVADNNAGPVPLVECQCPKCETKWNRMLEFNYQSFFDSSSL